MNLEMLKRAESQPVLSCPGCHPCRWLACLLGLLWFAVTSQAQVLVTTQFDTNRILVGQSTVLRVYAQVPLADRPNADRIFSWHIDLINTNGPVASANYAAMVKALSDKDPIASSSGTVQGFNLRGVFDTFMNQPGAGVLQPVELLSVAVTGVHPGRTRFMVLPGSGEPLLDYDFLVAPKGGGEDPLFPSGANYAVAFADLEVEPNALPPCTLNLTLTRLAEGGGPGGTLKLGFVPCPGYNHVVEETANLGAGAWTAIPGAPHNSGSVIVLNAQPSRFYRVRALTP